MKKFVVMLIIAVMLISLSSFSAVAETEFRFVIVPKVIHPWFDEVNKGAQKQAKLLKEALGVNVTVEYRAPSVADVTEQNTILLQSAATMPSGICLDPLDFNGNKAVIDEIKAQGIPVILFDSPAPAGSGLLSVGNNFTEQAQLAAEYLCKLLNYKGEVAVMQGFPTAPNHAERYQAHLDVLAKYPDIKFVDGGIDNDDIQTAQSQAAAVIAANPNLKGYLCCDAAGPIGIANAIREAGKQDVIMAVGMDNLVEILEAVQDGSLKATSSTKPQEQGALAILALLQAKIGGLLPAVIDTGIAFYTPGPELDAIIKAMK